MLEITNSLDFVYRDFSNRINAIYLGLTIDQQKKILRALQKSINLAIKEHYEPKDK